MNLTGNPARFDTWMTDTRFAFTVASPASIESYAIVQWIRGCMFHSSMTPNGVEKMLTISRRHFGEDKIFVHKDWEIDSDTFDPIYTAHEQYGRHALLRWNRNPESFNPETATWYSTRKPTHGSVFATDLPGPGMLSNGDGITSGIAQNATLDFRTCIFETRSLPKSTTPGGQGISMKKALWCVDWSHRFIWDFKKGVMTTASKIDEVCQ
jgi:hypothetical protein